MQYCRHFIVLSFVFAVVGCSSSDDPSARVGELNKTNIQKVANLYYAFQLENGYVGPKDVDALRSFAKSGSISPQQLTMMKIDLNDDKLFISERDGKPIKIRPSVVGGYMQ